jgi:hypothetical protein
MGYEKTQWQDRIVERPWTYQVQNNQDGTITLIPAPGTVIKDGTPVNAANLNHLETQYDEAKDYIDTEIQEVEASIAGIQSNLISHKINASGSGKHRWGMNKYLKGQGINNDPIEVELVPMTTVASDTVKHTNGDNKGTTSITYVKLKETKLSHSIPACRVKFSLSNNMDRGIGYARVYKNGVAIGSQFSANPRTYDMECSEDFTGFDTDDLIQVYGRTEGDGSANVSNLRICFDVVDDYSPYFTSQQ